MCRQTMMLLLLICHIICVYTFTPEEQHSILQHARRFAKKVVVITIESIDEMIENVGFKITDRCVAKEAAFTREIIICV